MQMPCYQLSLLLFLALTTTSCVNPKSTLGSQGELGFVSHGDSLAATLYLPNGSAPFPAAVIVHGSGSSDRSNPWTAAYVDALVQRGIAVLYPDKRGSGASQGDWRKADFEVLADDALAAFNRLLDVPDVDSDRAGLIGFSQGGDVAPLAATRSPKVRFVIDVSGSVVPLLEQIGDEIRQAGLAEGMNDPQLESLQSIHQLGSRYALTGEGWAAYSEALRVAEAGALKNSAVLGEFPDIADSPAWGFLRVVGNFDPMPYWKEVKVPVLFLFGGKDRNVDVRKSMAMIDRELSETDASHTILLFGNNGHAVFRHDAMDFIARWIHDKGID